jgi:uncharacterized protein
MELSPILQKIEHIAKSLPMRLPEAPWVAFMTWENLLFSSWPVPEKMIRPKVHSLLELDTFEGTPWVTLVGMHATNVHFRGVAPIKGLDSFRELNLRTYVKVKGRPGVTFLSIECPAAVVDWMSEQLFGYPYLQARVVGIEQENCFRIATERTQAGKPPAAFWGSFKVSGNPSAPVRGTLEHFLLERYTSFFVKDGAIYRAEIRHPEWMVQHAEPAIEVNTIPPAAGLVLPEKPLHAAFVSRTDTFVWLPVRER